jgi:hypothetical protein
LVVAAATVFTTYRREQIPKPGASEVGAYLVLVVALGGLATRFPTPTPIAIGLLIGAVTVLASLYLGKTPSASLAIGVAGAAATHLVRENNGTVNLAFSVALGLALLFFGANDIARTAVAGVVIAAASTLGSYTDSTETAPLAANYFALLMVVASLLTIKQKGLLKRAGIVGVLGLAASFLIAKYWLYQNPALMCLGLAVVTAVLLQTVLNEGDDSDPLRLGIATVSWVALGTIAFALYRGYGVSLVLAAGALTLLAMDGQKSVLAMGPLVGIVFYRIFRESQPDIAKALDIGQHYAIVGLLIGSLIPLLPIDWRVGRSGNKAAIGAFLWGLLLLAVPAILTLVLAAKGIVGFLVGLGLSSIWGARSKESSLGIIGLASALSASTVVAFGWLSDVEELTRDEKVRIFTYSVVIILILGLTLALLSRKPASSESK